MTANVIATIAEFGTSIGTLALAFATVCTLREMRAQGKIDKINKELNLLIIPMKRIYETGPKMYGRTWWGLYTTTKIKPLDPHISEEFRDAVNKADQNIHLAPQKMYPLIYDLLSRLKEMRRSEAEDFQELLQKAVDNLYNKENVGGGLIEIRYGELTRELYSITKIKWWQFWK